jgi:hypothetical protein
MISKSDNAAIYAFLGQPHGNRVAEILSSCFDLQYTYQRCNANTYIFMTSRHAKNVVRPLSRTSAPPVQQSQGVERRASCPGISRSSLKTFQVCWHRRPGFEEGSSPHPRCYYTNRAPNRRLLPSSRLAFADERHPPCLRLLPPPPALPTPALDPASLAQPRGKSGERAPFMAPPFLLRAGGGRGCGDGKEPRVGGQI